MLDDGHEDENMAMKLARITALVLIFAPCLCAQRTWIVDAAQGLGTDFKDIPAAVVAARDGDTILVRIGVYSAWQTDKPLQIFGAFGARIRCGFADVCKIYDIDVAERFVLSGFSFEDAFPITGRISYVEVDRCKGAVHLDGLGFASSREELSTIRDCDLVTISHVRTNKRIRIENARVTMHDSTIVADTVSLTAESPALLVTKSDVDLTACQVRGANGNSRIAPSPAIVASAATLVIRGDSAAFVAGGVLRSQQAVAARGDAQSSLQLDPAVPVIGGIQGFRVTRTRMAALRVAGGPLGGQKTFDVEAAQGNLVVIFGAAPSRSLATPIGNLWLGLSTLYVVGAQQMDATEHWRLKTAIPMDPKLRGLVLAYQLLDIGTSEIALSNAAVAMLR